MLYVANSMALESHRLITGIYGYVLYVDTVNDKIYYDEEYTPALMRANLDGTGDRGVYKNPDALVGKSRIYGITSTRIANKLYWSNRDAGEIYRANLDGTGKRRY